VLFVARLVVRRGDIVPVVFSLAMTWVLRKHGALDG
jgi:hypothetical protein